MLSGASAVGLKDADLNEAVCDGPGWHYGGSSVAILGLRCIKYIIAITTFSETGWGNLNSTVTMLSFAATNNLMLLQIIKGQQFTIIALNKSHDQTIDRQGILEGYH
jgi:hypothetical protein